MSIPLEVVLDRAGRTPYRLTPNQDSLRWTTAAVGGFGSCTFTLPGPPPFWKREIPHLSMLRIVLDTFVIWEGHVEDITLSMKDETTSVTCFGLQRLLDLTSVRRIWSKRDIDLQVRSPSRLTPDPAFVLTTGTFDTADPTHVGVQVVGNGQTAVTGKATGAVYLAPSGITFSSVAFTRQKAGNANLLIQLWSSADGDATATNHLSSNVNTTTGDSATLVSNANVIVFTQNLSAGFATTSADLVRFYDIRVFGTSLTEDNTGAGIGANGFYGGTILRDLIALVPGLTQGVIDAGSDFTIASIERSVRSSARAVVEEVAGYYTREWRVWEDGRFDWKSVNADEPHWIATLDDLDSGSELTSTVDGLAKTLYVLYTDAASGMDAESSATSSDQRNPFVKQGQTSDVVVQPGFPMTSSTASQLGSKLITDQGGYPLVQGRLVIPATKTIKRASGTPLPAFMIRGGDNIVVSDLPKTDLFSQGRDGETLFHIVSTETSLEDGSTTLEIEGQTRRSDVLLARLAAATRGVTG